jgi:hypothetical protein
VRALCNKMSLLEMKLAVKVVVMAGFEGFS